MSFDEVGGVAAEQHARAVALLKRYPALSAEELDELRNWFDRVASALEVGLIASDPDLADQYRAFRDEQVEPFRRSEFIAISMVCAAAVIAVLVLAA